jgi:hypothetical protein
MTQTRPQNRRLGSARVSTYGQTLDVQLEQLRGSGCTKIFCEKVTGAHNAAANPQIAEHHRARRRGER